MPDFPGLDEAMVVAASLSRLVAAGDRRSLDSLFRDMHPDAQALIPKEAVVGWFEGEGRVLSPLSSTATKAHFVTWTWGVTGRVYSEAAEVALHNIFPDGTTQRELVHLVKDDYGTWGWFFGSDRAFVEEQIERFGSAREAPTS